MTIPEHKKTYSPNELLHARAHAAWKHAVLPARFAPPPPSDNLGDAIEAAITAGQKARILFLFAVAEACGKTDG